MEEIKQIREALKFYVGGEADYKVYTRTIQNDMGEKAEQALKALDRLEELTNKEEK